VDATACHGRRPYWRGWRRRSGMSAVGGRWGFAGRAGGDGDRGGRPVSCGGRAHTGVLPPPGNGGLPRADDGGRRRRFTTGLGGGCCDSRKNGVGRSRGGRGPGPDRPSHRVGVGGGRDPRPGVHGRTTVAGDVDRSPRRRLRRWDIRGAGRAGSGDRHRAAARPGPIAARPSADARTGRVRCRRPSGVERGNRRAHVARRGRPRGAAAADGALRHGPGLPRRRPRRLPDLRRRAEPLHRTGAGHPRGGRGKGHVLPDRLADRRIPGRGTTAHRRRSHAVQPQLDPPGRHRRPTSGADRPADRPDPAGPSPGSG
jgi:hypothetical protein